MMGLSWDEVDGVMRRGVECGLERRQERRKLPREGAQRLKGNRYLWLNRGYRNRQRFRDAIYFHFGGLDVYPKGVAQRPLTHTNS